MKFWQVALAILMLKSLELLWAGVALDAARSSEVGSAPFVIVTAFWLLAAGGIWATVEAIAAVASKRDE